MNHKSLFSLIVTILVLASCNKPIDIENFDEAKWQSDKNGCNGLRLAMKEDLSKAIKDMQGLDTDEIIKILGRPDKNELYKRNQKFFIYHISPGENCPNNVTKQAKISLNVRFNAMGLAKEIMIYKN